MTPLKLSFYYKFLLVVMVGLCLVYELSSFHTEIMMACGLLGLPIWLSKFRSLSKSKQLLLVFSFFFLLIIVFYKVLGVSTCDNDIVAAYIDWTIILLFALFFPVFQLSKKENMFLILVIYSLITIQLVSTIRSGNAMVAAGDYDTDSLRITEFGSMAMFFSAGCLLWFFHDRRFFCRILSLAGVALSLYVIFVIQQRAINAISSIVMLALIIVVNNKSKKKLLGIAAAVFGVLILLLITRAYIPIMDFLVDNIGSIRLSERLADLRDFLVGGDFFAQDRFSGRSSLLIVSITSWLSTPLSFFVGVGDHRGNNTIVGNHGEYFDLLARYGIFGEALYILITVLFVKFLLSFCSKQSNERFQIWIVALVFIFRNIVGIVSVYEVAIPLLLFTQAVLKIKKKEKKPSPSYAISNLRTSL